MWIGFQRAACDVATSDRESLRCVVLCDVARVLQAVVCHGGANRGRTRVRVARVHEQRGLKALSC
eukprot:163391-Lingulodinium_polyedra.AAC.1